MKAILPSALVVTALLFSPISLSKPYGSGGGGGGVWEDRRSQKMEALAELPKEKRALVRETMQNMREQGHSQRETIKAAREELKALFTAETFDAERYAAKAREVHSLHGKMHENRIQAIVNLGSQLNQEEREIVSEVLKPKKFKHRR